MKSLFVLVALLSSSSALAKDYRFSGDKARTLMETLATAGFEVKNIDKEWGTLREPLSIVTGPFLCHYNGIYPDGWMVNVTCNKGKDGNGERLNSPLALAQAVKGMAYSDVGLGNRWLVTDNVTCSLNYETRKYRCVLSAAPQQE